MKKSDQNEVEEIIPEMVQKYLQRNVIILSCSGDTSYGALMHVPPRTFFYKIRL